LKTVSHFNFNSAVAKKLLLSAAITMACQTSTAVAAPYKARGCQADPNWISQPSLPTEVSSSDQNCAFHQFMWQSFLYLVTPSQQSPDLKNFETWMPSYGMFVPAGETPTKWGQTASPDYCQVQAQDGYVYSNLTLQAGSDQPLIDQNKNPVYYGMAVNKPAYDFITQCDLYQSQCGLSLAPDLLDQDQEAVVNIPLQYPHLAFPDGSVELKTAWKVLSTEEQESELFFVRQGMVQFGQTESETCEPVTFGLVGMHIVSNTPNNPEFIWATFENKNNVPDCSNLSAKPAKGNWSFLSRDCAKDANCITNEYLGSDTPAEICRMHPWGDPTLGTWPDDLNCRAQPTPSYVCNRDVQKNVIVPNTVNLIMINRSVNKLLSQSKDYALWANYELVGNMWTKYGYLPPYLQVQQGSLSAANSTMESFVQNGVSGKTNPTNCFSCHNLDGKTQVLSAGGVPKPIQLPPAGLSHIFNLMHLNTGGCKDGKLPAACSAYFNK
jgi:hypothetical protein